MTCEEFLRLMDEDRLEEAATDAGLHAEACPACRSALARWQAVRMEFRGMRDEPAPPFLHTRVMAHVEEEQERASRGFAWLSWFRVSWATPVLVLAIGALLGGYGMWQVLGPSRRAVQPERKAEAPQAAKPKVEQEGRPAQKSAPVRQDEDKGPARDGALAGSSADTAAESKGRAQLEPVPAAPAPAGQPVPQPLLAPQSSGQEWPSKKEVAAGAASTAESQAPPAAKDDLAREAAPRPPQAETANAPAEEAAPSEVVCTIKSLDSGRLVALQLPAELAPPAGAQWSVTLTDKGGILIQDFQGRKLESPASGLAQVLYSLHLEAGHYVLRRIS